MRQQNVHPSQDLRGTRSAAHPAYLTAMSRSSEDSLRRDPVYSVLCFS